MKPFKFPDLILDKQDKTSKYYPDYHWVECRNSIEKRNMPFDCFLLKRKNGYDYYMPIEQPYEICRRHNYPEEHLGNYITLNSENECKALVNLVPENVVMPTFDFIGSISPDKWLKIYCEIIKANPEKIKYLANYHFCVLPNDKYKNEKIFKQYYMICYPFIGMEFKDGMLQYIDGVWIDSSFYRKANYNNNIGNILMFDKSYHTPEYSTWVGIYPIIKVKHYSNQ
ncbi:MAG: hypothetical protein IKO36_11015 [Bacteroidaceae bacterium]|nr:hypothetical protein [Bacteroidaceae bacterium]